MRVVREREQVTSARSPQVSPEEFAVLTGLLGAAEAATAAAVPGRCDGAGGGRPVPRRTGPALPPRSARRQALSARQGRRTRAATLVLVALAVAGLVLWQAWRGQIPLPFRRG